MPRSLFQGVKFTEHYFDRVFSSVSQIAFPAAASSKRIFLHNPKLPTTPSPRGTTAQIFAMANRSNPGTEPGLRGINIPRKCTTDPATLAQWIGLESPAAVRAWMTSSKIAGPYNELYEHVILPRSLEKGGQGPMLKMVESAIIAGEGLGDMKYTADEDDLQKDTWNDIDWYAYTMLRLRKNSTMTKDAPFRNKSMSHEEVDARNWVTMLRETKLRHRELTKEEQERKRKQQRRKPDPQRYAYSSKKRKRSRENGSAPRERSETRGRRRARTHSASSWGSSKTVSDSSDLDYQDAEEEPKTPSASKRKRDEAPLFLPPSRQAVMDDVRTSIASERTRVEVSSPPQRQADVGGAEMQSVSEQASIEVSASPPRQVDDEAETPSATERARVEVCPTPPRQQTVDNTEMPSASKEVRVEAPIIPPSSRQITVNNATVEHRRNEMLPQRRRR